MEGVSNETEVKTGVERIRELLSSNAGPLYDEAMARLNALPEYQGAQETNVSPTFAKRIFTIGTKNFIVEDGYFQDPSASDSADIRRLYVAVEEGDSYEHIKIDRGNKGSKFNDITYRSTSVPKPTDLKYPEGEIQAAKGFIERNLSAPSPPHI